MGIPGADAFFVRAIARARAVRDCGTHNWVIVDVAMALFVIHAGAHAARGSALTETLALSDFVARGVRYIRRFCEIAPVVIVACDITGGPAAKAPTQAARRASTAPMSESQRADFFERGLIPSIAAVRATPGARAHLMRALLDALLASPGHTTPGGMLVLHGHPDSPDEAITLTSSADGGAPTLARTRLALQHEADTQIAHWAGALARPGLVQANDKDMLLILALQHALALARAPDGCAPDVTLFMHSASYFSYASTLTPARAAEAEDKLRAVDADGLRAYDAPFVSIARAVSAIAAHPGAAGMTPLDAVANITFLFTAFACDFNLGNWYSRITLDTVYTAWDALGRRAPLFVACTLHAAGDAAGDAAGAPLPTVHVTLDERAFALFIGTELCAPPPKLTPAGKPSRARGRPMPAAADIAAAARRALWTLLYWLHASLGAGDAGAPDALARCERTGLSLWGWDRAPDGTVIEAHTVAPDLGRERATVATLAPLAPTRGRKRAREPVADEADERAPPAPPVRALLQDSEYEPE